LTGKLGLLLGCPAAGLLGLPAAGLLGRWATGVFGFGHALDLGLKTEAKPGEIEPQDVELAGDLGLVTRRLDNESGETERWGKAFGTLGLLGCRAAGLRVLGLVTGFRLGLWVGLDAASVADWRVSKGTHNPFCEAFKHANKLCSGVVTPISATAMAFEAGLSALALTLAEWMLLTLLELHAPVFLAWDEDAAGPADPSAFCLFSGPVGLDLSAVASAGASRKGEVPATASW